LTAAAVPTVTATVTITAATERTRTKDRRTKERGRKEEAKCFGFGRNGGGSKWESCSEHDGYPAKFQLHDTSLCFFGGEPALEL
jgi:hypothetical protein